MLIFLTNQLNSPSKTLPLDLNLISADGTFSFQLFLAQKYMYYCNPLRLDHSFKHAVCCFFKIIFLSSSQEVKIEEGKTEADKEDLTRCTPVDEVKEISSDNEKTEETDKTEDDDASVASSNFRPVTAPAGTMESQRVEQKNEK